MPLFAIHATDREGALPLRMEHYAAHRAFIETHEKRGVDIVMSGPLQSDDGEVMIGSLFLMEAPDRAAVEAFLAADPFMTQKIWGDISITRFHRRKG